MPLSNIAPAILPFPAAGGPHAGNAGNAPQAATTRKLKLSAILDPTLDAEIVPLPPDEIARMYEDYRTKFGDHPGSDSDPSSDQLAALKQVLASGAVPFACFTTWGPHGQRLLRKQTFTGYQLNVASGEWSKKEQPGPSSFHAWYRCWRVYRTALLLLDSCDPERLDSYAETIRGFVTQFGDECWFLVARADAQMRSGANSWSDYAGSFGPVRHMGSQKRHHGLRALQLPAKTMNTGRRSSAPLPPSS